MGKDPAFLFYPGDYLRDTQCLSANAQVAYDRIMCEHMRNICISQQQLNFFTKRLSDDEKEEIMHLLRNVDGGFQIEWVAESISKRRNYSESRRKNRSGKNKKHMLTYVKHMENENENINIVKNISKNIDKNNLEKMFIEFYKFYPKKISVKKAREKFFKIKPDHALFEKMMAALARQKASVQWQKDNGQFIPHPATWLNQERWNDEDEAMVAMQAGQQRVAEKIAKLEKMLGRAYDPQIDGNITPD